MLRGDEPFTLSQASPSAYVTSGGNGYQGFGLNSEICGRRVTSHAALLAQVRSDATVQAGAESKDYLSFSPRGAGTPMVAWTFTKPGHPAHPSVVCRMLVQQPGGAWNMDMRTLCASSKAQCNRLQADFVRLNADMSRAIQQGGQYRR